MIALMSFSRSHRHRRSRRIIDDDRARIHLALILRVREYAGFAFPICRRPQMNRIARALAAQLIIAVAVGAIVFNISGTRVAGANGPEAPRFEVDPMWPKPLPNHWILGNVRGR